MTFSTDMYIFSFQQFSFTIVFQYLHLLNGYLVELHESFALGHTVVDEYGIDIFHVREANKLIDGGIVTDIALEVWIGLALAIIPIAPVRSIHALTDNTKLLLPAAFLIVSNSVQLKLGLYSISHSPRYSIVLFKLIHLNTMCSCIWL